MPSKQSQITYILCLILGSLLVAFSQVSVALADGPWYVSPTGDDDATCQSPGNACQTIAAAVAKAAAGDTVIVAAGTYTEHITLDKNLVLQGAGQTNTVVDGNASGRVFTVTAGSAVTIAGMAITNGRAADGGGIRNDGVLALGDCVISGNIAAGTDGDDVVLDGSDGMGGGIYNSHVLTLSNCSIVSNAALGGNGAITNSFQAGDGGSGAGGGIYSDGSLALTSCTLDDNTANGGRGGDNSEHGIGGSGGQGQGGGIYISGTLALDDCTLGHNMANGGDGGDGDSFSPSDSMGGGGQGGGIYISGTLTLDDCALSRNAANGGDGGESSIPGPMGSMGGAGEGGGIYSIGSLTLTDCLVNGHTVTGGEAGGMVGIDGAGNGGGIWSSGTLTLSNTTVISNDAGNGGGIYSDAYLTNGSDVTLIQTTVSRNDATADGGGIRHDCTNNFTCSLALINSTISDNIAERGAGIYTSGASGALSRMSIQDSTTINGNYAYYQGGGIFTRNQINGTKFITLTNSTLSGNSAVMGGGICAYTTGQSTNTTAFLNSTIVSNTITGTASSGSGIYAFAGGGGSGLAIVVLENTIVANIPFTTNCATSGGGIITSTGRNLESGSSCGFEAFEAMEASSMDEIDLGIGPLQDNGGNTQTHALLAGSPALDRGDLDICLSSFVRGVDQRGIIRPQGSGCDIGAFEMVVDDASSTKTYLPIVLKN